MRKAQVISAINRRIAGKIKRTEKGQQLMDKILHIKATIEQHEPHDKPM